MAVDYAGIAAEVAVALDEVSQGIILLTKPGTTTPGAEPWDPPVPGTPVTYTMSGTAKGVSKEYINGTTILSTDIELLLSTKARNGAGALVEVSPDFGADTLTVDGKAVTLVRDLSVPAAGVRVVLKYIVRA